MEKSVDSDLNGVVVIYHRDDEVTNPENIKLYQYNTKLILKPGFKFNFGLNNIKNSQITILKILDKPFDKVVRKYSTIKAPEILAKHISDLKVDSIGHRQYYLPVNISEATGTKYLKIIDDLDGYLTVSINSVYIVDNKKDAVFAFTPLSKHSVAYKDKKAYKEIRMSDLLHPTYRDMMSDNAVAQSEQLVKDWKVATDMIPKIYVDGFAQSAIEAYRKPKYELGSCRKIDDESKNLLSSVLDLIPNYPLEYYLDKLK